MARAAGLVAEALAGAPERQYAASLRPLICQPFPRFCNTQPVAVLVTDETLECAVRTSQYSGDVDADVNSLGAQRTPPARTTAGRGYEARKSARNRRMPAARNPIGITSGINDSRLRSTAFDACPVEPFFPLRTADCGGLWSVVGALKIPRYLRRLVAGSVAGTSDSVGLRWTTLDCSHGGGWHSVGPPIDLKSLPVRGAGSSPAPGMTSLGTCHLT